MKGKIQVPEALLGEYNKKKKTVPAVYFEYYLLNFPKLQNVVPSCIVTTLQVEQLSRALAYEYTDSTIEQYILCCNIKNANFVLYSLYKFAV